MLSKYCRRGHKEANHRADDFFSSSSSSFFPFLSSSWEKKRGGRHKRKEEAGNHVTSNLLIFCLEKEVGVLSGQGVVVVVVVLAGMKYIANGKRHQQEIGARRWRPCLIKTNCRWGWIFIL